MRRREFVLFAAWAGLAWPLKVVAQQPPLRRKVGMLTRVCLQTRISRSRMK